MEILKIKKSKLVHYCEHVAELITISDDDKNEWFSKDLDYHFKIVDKTQGGEPLNNPRIQKDSNVIEFPPRIKSCCDEYIVFVIIQLIYLKHITEDGQKTDDDFLSADKMAMQIITKNAIDVETRDFVNNLIDGFFLRPTALNKKRMEAIIDTFIPRLKGMANQEKITE